MLGQIFDIHCRVSVTLRAIAFSIGSVVEEVTEL